MQLTDAPSWGWAPWSPDGARIVFTSSESSSGDIYVVDSEGGVPQLVSHEPSEVREPTFSRDGRFIYFASDRSGRFEIWKMPADGGTAVQVTRGGGYAAQESWDARYVYYSKAPNRGLWRVPVEGGDEAAVPGVQATEWFQWALSRTGIYWGTRSAPKPWTQDYAIHFSDFQSGRSETLFRIRNHATSIFLAVSPDEEWILYSEEPYPQSELMLVENFR